MPLFFLQLIECMLVRHTSTSIRLKTNYHNDYSLEGSLFKWGFRQYLLLGGFGDEKMCETVKSILLLVDTHLFSEPGSLAYEKCPSDEIYTAITLGSRCP